MKNSEVKHRLSGLLGGLCGAALMLSVSGCTDDLLEGTPTWLGTSIYEELESRGNYTTTLALINSSPVAGDNYRQILSLTGSKTLFVADDDAWQRFFDKNKELSEINPWHTITSTESFDAAGNELLVRRLFKGMMLNNAYVLDLLGNLSGNASSVNVEDGADECMRRETSISNLDMMGSIAQADFPPLKLDNASGVSDIDWWAEVRSKESLTTMPAVLNGVMNIKGSADYLYTNNGNPDLPTMMHFSPSFAVSKGFTSEDVSILSDGVATSTSQTVVNGVAIDPDNSNITCQNGYIHKLAEVPYPVSNMVEKLSYEPDYSIFYKQLQRFSYPYRNAVQMRNVGATDSVYTVRYINNGDYASHCALTTSYDGDKVATSYLPYDPAWNQYYLYNTDGSYTYQMDAALMLVPNNNQMTSFLTNEGIDLTEKYAMGNTPSWDYYPDALVAELMQNCMLPNFLSYLPSGVDKIKDTSQSQIEGLDASKIKDCFVCGNGVIYGLDMTITPPTYKDVTSTMLLNKEEDLDLNRDQGFSVFYNFIQKDKQISGASAGYASYLSSFDGTKYVLFCPYDKAMRKVIDPSSMTRTTGIGSETGPVLYEYHFDGTRYMPYAYPMSYAYDDLTGTATPTGMFSRMFQYDDFAPQTSANNWYYSNAYKLLKYIMENSICPVYGVAAGESALSSQYTYYKTKSGAAIKVDWKGGNSITTAEYAGGHQKRYNRSVKSTAAADKANGVSVPVEEVLLPATLSPYKVLQTEFPEFLKLLTSGDVSRQSEYLATNDGNTDHKIFDESDYAISIFKPYNYTIYIPTKAAMDVQVNNYKLARRDWMEAIPESDNDIKSAFTGISDDDLASLKNLRDSMKLSLNRYVAYHIQDYGVYLGQKDTTGVFETSLVNLETNLFYGLHVSERASDGVIEVYPRGYSSQMVEVDPSNCNHMATQNYYIESTGSTSTEKLSLGQIYSSSYVVMHQIKDNKDFGLPDEMNPWSQSQYERLKTIFDTYGVALVNPVQN